MLSLLGATLLTFLSPPVHGATVPTPPDMTGSWALELELVSAAMIPVLGSLESKTLTYGRIHTASSDPGVVQLYEVCDVSLVDRGAFVTSRIPEAFVDALPVRTLHPETTTSQDGWRYQVDLGATHVGYDPALSGGRPPTSASDPAILDCDGDGAPGATVMVSIPLFSDVAIHITQGAAMSLEGSWIGPDLIRGDAVVRTLEQNVVSASNRLFARSLTIRPVNEESHFTLVRVADGTSCGEVPALLSASRQTPDPTVARAR